MNFKNILLAALALVLVPAASKAADDYKEQDMTSEYEDENTGDSGMEAEETEDDTESTDESEVMEEE